MPLAPASEPKTRIGPNAIWRTYDALIAFDGQAGAERIMASAGLAHYCAALPAEMVDEDEVSALMAAVARAHAPMRADTVGWLAGNMTGDYLLANRIPALAQRALKLLPPALAARALTKAIGQHTWTFAGSGQVTIISGHPTVIEIGDCVLCRQVTARDPHSPCCSFYGGTFERLFQELVDGQARVREVSCRAQGDRVCRFEIRWRR